MTRSRSGPLSGLRVVELSGGVAGPYATKLLADFGADVIKVEPPEGDQTRRWGPFPDAKPDHNRSGAFIALNVGKHSVILDLSSAGDRAHLRRLIKGADALVESLGPGRLSAAGLTPDELARLNPRLIVTSLSPFGEDGPYRDYTTTPMVAHAIGGVMYSMGAPEREPVRAGGPHGWHIAGLYAAIATLRGLWQRRTDGLGRQFTIAEHEAIVGTKIYDTVAFQYTGRYRRRSGHRYVAASPMMVTLPCKDGYVGVHIVLAHQWRNLCAFMGQPELADDPRFAAPADRTLHGAEWEAILGAFLAQHPAEWLYHEGQRRRIPFCMLPTADQVLASPQRRRRGFFVMVEDAAGKCWELPGPITMLSGMSRGGILRAPSLGEHMADVPAGAEAEPGDAPAVRAGDSSLRVLDLSMGWAGPLTGQLLSDMGAEVIKVESCSHPDWWRGQYHHAPPEQRLWEMAPTFNSVNCGKLGITLELSHPRGNELLRMLVSRSDVLIENFSPGVMEKLGLGWETLRAINPRLVMLSMPVNGLDGPERDYVGFGMNVESMAGLTQLAGYEDGPPQLMPNALGDPVSGLNGAVAALVALLQRDRTGQGQRVELAQVEGLIPFIADALLEYQMTGRLRPRMGNHHPAMAPHNVYPCKAGPGSSIPAEDAADVQGDDQWVAIAVTDDGQWQALRRAMDEPAWAADPRFATTAGRLAHQDEIDAALAAWTALQDKRDVMERLQACGIPAGALLHDADLLSDPHLAAREFFEPIERDVVGMHLYPGPVIRMSGERQRRAAAPTLGEHNAPVLHRILALSAEEIRQLEDEGVIGTAPSS